MILNEQNKLSYIKKLMFREELFAMLRRDFDLDISMPVSYDISVILAEPPIISTEVTENYTCYPTNSVPFQINIRNLMIEQEALNMIKVISEIKFPENFSWPVVADEEVQKSKEMDCFTGGVPSKWNRTLIDRCTDYYFTENYYLGYRDTIHKRTPMIVQLSSFDPFRMIEYSTDVSKGFEVNLDHCDETKWRGNSKAQYSIKRDKNGLYRIY